MNKIDFQQAGGFPLETDTLDFAQSAYTALQAIASLGGDNYILSGCVVAGANVSDGFVVINGEVLTFRGGLAQTNIVIREDKQNRAFENGQVKDVFLTRYATFGTGVNAIPFASLNRLKSLTEFKDLLTAVSSAIDLDSESTLATSKAVKTLNDKINAQLPSGAIVIWSGLLNNIPNGWALCNGDNGTPNLVNRFVYGAGGARAIGDGADGEEKHQLNVSELPNHSFKVRLQVNRVDNANYTNVLSNPGEGDRDEWREINTNEIGGDMPHNNMPPYYVLAYIMKL